MRKGIIYKEFYNKDRSLPEPLWGGKCRPYKGVQLKCSHCGSLDIYYSAHPDDPHEITRENIRCKVCGRITDWYEAYKQGKNTKEGS